MLGKRLMVYNSGNHYLRLNNNNNLHNLKTKKHMLVKLGKTQCKLLLL